jgi:phosphoenolpyruvate carboxykinase (ATP)
MNTGSVGGGEGSANARKVKIRHSSAVVQAIAEGTIDWERDADFGYDVAARVPGIDGDDEMLLQPREYYRRTERKADYERIVAKLKQERAAHLNELPGLDPRIISAVG